VLLIKLLVIVTVLFELVKLPEGCLQYFIFCASSKSNQFASSNLLTLQIRRDDNSTLHYRPGFALLLLTLDE
jgi:hypothetical protein